MLFLTICMFLFPQATYTGARYGLETWALTLAPSLLPFIIVTDILIELGVVRFLGVLLEPLMRPVFKQPGEAGFAVAMGFTSGFPMGAILTTSLYEKNICTKNEAARLVTFTNNASPLFLLVAIPVGMLNAPHVGVILLTSHYLANLLIGIIGGFLAKTDPLEKPAAQSKILSRSFHELLNYHTQAPPIGTILGKAVNKGIKSILSIGGFVLFFSVTIEILKTIGFFEVTNYLFAQILMWFHLNPCFSSALSSGIFEMTLGTKAAASSDGDLFGKLIIISFILAWSGLSIHAQVGSIISAKGIAVTPYCVCRFIQGFLSAAIIACLLLFFPETITVLPQILTFSEKLSLINFMVIFPLGNLLLLLFLSLCCLFLQKMKGIIIIKTK